MWTATSAKNRTGNVDRPALRRAAPRCRRFGAAAGLVGMLGLVGTAGLPAGCGGARQVQRSAPLEREIELNRKATTAFERGHYETALAGYREALRISRAIEHIDGIAANLLDLAAVHRVGGSEAQAVLAVDEILADEKHAFAAPRRSAAAYLRALLFADAQDFPNASRLAADALALCRESACGNGGRIVNLQARVAYLAGDPAAALAAAQRALFLNREAQADEETANSLRIAADAHCKLGDLAEAAAGFAEALALDKKLGLAGKIRLDLMRLGDVAAGQARVEEARAYYRRAEDVSRGAADGRGLAEAADRLRGLGEAR